MSAQELEVFELKIITPEKTIFSGAVKSLALESEDGFIEIYPGHEPMLCPLRVGVMSMTKSDDDEDKILAVHGGFLEISSKGAMILADAAEVGDDIDVDRARASQQRAKEHLASNTDAEDTDKDRAKFALLRAIARINAAEGKFLYKN